MSSSDNKQTYGYVQPFFEEFVRAVCSLLKGQQLAICMDIFHEDLVNIIYTITLGKRKLKFLQDHVCALLASDYYFDKDGQRILSKDLVQQAIKNKTKISDVIYVSDLNSYQAYAVEDLVTPKRDHMEDMIRLA